MQYVDLGERFGSEPHRWLADSLQLARRREGDGDPDMPRWHSLHHRRRTGPHVAGHRGALAKNNIHSAYLATSQDASGTYHLLVEAPGVIDQQALIGYLSEGNIRFLDTESRVPLGSIVKPTDYPVVFTGQDLDRSSVKVGTNSANEPVVDFAMQGSAKQRFADYTASHIGAYLTITLDWVIIESAVIQTKITGQVEISGGLSQEEANRLAEFMQSAPLPLAATNISATVVPHP